MADAKDSSMVDSKSSSTSPSQHQQHTSFFMAQDTLRILAILLSAASIVVMVTNTQTVLLFSIRFQAHFYYSPSFKFFVAANGVVTALSLLTLIVKLLMRQQASRRKDYYFVLITHDIVMTVLLIAGCAAATAIGYVGQFGEEHVGWQPVCDHVRKFCRTNLVSLLLSYVAFLAYLGVTILSAYKCIASSPNN
ncbi:CASP-like protein 1F2 [Abrus precatorius]|uniref:CASP-like protein n=1 Tax=Abrus precatorius TaxID=3816 RepID=A0A8B8LDR5_ABRPR|nr:CASP-like protein 1F2 [Abrus precatorius]